ncbi:CPBP family intramembrane glutamic endopeptidase [Marimonas lutisalis]|uniref:CPBP family intramembrane glutamic endopeptidase n=1 Tax=Marimonas lutisalis TaxID=2545756 RepID=UPI0010F61E06|nr:CPBP family intramembrane glutamic endopeptidase [Marimonas lutisalis]
MTHRRPSPYAAHRGFIAPALGTPGLRPVILGFIVIETLYEIGQRAFGYLLDTFAPAFADSVFYGDTPPGMLTNLASFLILILTLTLVLRFVHGRGLASLLGPPGLAFTQFRAALLPLAAVVLLVELSPPWWSLDTIAEIRPPLLWLALLPIGMAALLIQTSAEELFYRGYLQQHIAALMPWPVAWLVIPNLVFALAHWNAYAPLIINAQYLLWAFVFGLAASDLTARSGSLGPAIALHLVNNAYAFLFYGELRGPDSGLALFLFDPDAVMQPFSPDEALPFLPVSLIVELILVGLMWLAVRVALRR